MHASCSVLLPVRTICLARVFVRRMLLYLTLLTGAAHEAFQVFERYRTDLNLFELTALPGLSSRAPLVLKPALTIKVCTDGQHPSPAQASCAKEL
jgi:hypothetical protein